MEYFSDMQDFMWRYSYDTLEIILMFIGGVILVYSLVQMVRERRRIFSIMILLSFTSVVSISMIFYVQFIRVHTLQDIEVSHIDFKLDRVGEFGSVHLDDTASDEVHKILNKASYRITFKSNDSPIYNEEAITLGVYNRENMSHFYIVLDEEELIKVYHPSRSRMLELYINANELYEVLIDSI